MVGFSALWGYLAVFFGFLSKGVVWKKFGVVGMLPCFDLMKHPYFGTNFQLEKEGIWTSIPHGNCSCNCELDVRLLNHLNLTSIA